MSADPTDPTDPMDPTSPTDNANDVVDVLQQLALSSSSDHDDDYEDNAAPIAVAVDLSKYVGVWYQTYASLGPEYTFGLEGRNVSEFYAPTSRAGVISVNHKAIPVKLSKNGFAVKSKSHSGKFHVSLDPPRQSLHAVRFEEPGNYWVLGVGPVVNGLYDWAIVSDSTKSSLQILTRNVIRFETRYEKPILGIVASLGFTKEKNKPHKTIHH